VSAGLIIFALGFFLLNRVDDAATFYGVFVIIALGSGLCGYLTINIVLMNWFERNRSTAIALSATGGSLAGLMVPVVAWALSTYGWRTTAVASGVLLLVVGLPLAQAIRQAPEPYGYLPDGAKAPPGGSAVPQTDEGQTGGFSGASGGFTAREALHTRAFWLLATGHGLALMSVSAVAAHLIPFLVSQMDMTIEAAASMVAVLTGASVVIHLIGGFVGDRVNRRLLATLCMVVHTAALLVLVAATSPLAVALFAALQGTAWGFRGPLMTPIRAEYFGRRAIATLEGFAAMVTTAGLTIGPIAAGFIADQTGDYRFSFLFIAAMTSIGMVCFGFATRPRLPERAPESGIMLQSSGASPDA
jgi:MFS family permease